MDSVYHRRSSCAETGQGNTTNEYCRKCIRHGVVDKSNVLESLWIVESPCVVCAMADGGFWGWVEGKYGEEEYRVPDNGVLPGHCGPDIIPDIRSLFRFLLPSDDEIEYS